MVYCKKCGTLNDDKLGAITCPNTTLASGAGMTCWAVTTNITVDTTNVGGVMGIAPDNESVSSNDDAFVDVISPSINIVKTANPSVVIIGSNVTYTYVITNDGVYATDTMYNITLYDDKLGSINITENCNTSITTLLVNESIKCNLTTNITVDTVNTAFVNGTTSDGKVPTDNDTASVVTVWPDVNIEKTSSK